MKHGMIQGRQGNHTMIIPSIMATTPRNMVAMTSSSDDDDQTSP